MKISQEFTVASPRAQVWEFFHAISSVVQCLPGAELTDDKGDGTFTGKISIKLGMVKAAFEGQGKMTWNEDDYTAQLTGKAIDKRNASRTSMSVNYQFLECVGGTLVKVETDFALSGTLAQFGRTGIITDVANNIMKDFVACLEQKLAVADAGEDNSEISAGEINAFTLLIAMIRSWFRRIFKKIFGNSKL